MLGISLTETFAKCFQDKCIFSKSIRKYTCIDSSEQKRHRKDKPALMGLGFCRALGEGRVERRGGMETGWER